MITSVPIREWESKSVLMRHLSECGRRGLAVGLDAEAPSDFYSISVPPDGALAEIGIITSGHGVRPQAVLLDTGRRILVGHDHWLTWISLEPLAITSSLRIEGVFFEFLPVDLGDEIVVIEELGAWRVRADGSVRWSVEPGDIVEDWSVNDGGDLVLTRFEDHSKMVVSLASGKPR